MRNDEGNDVTADEEGPGVVDMARALRDVQQRYGLAEIAGTRRLTDGHKITMRWSDDLLELEREDGEVVLLDPVILLAGEEQ